MAITLITAPISASAEEQSAPTQVSSEGQQVPVGDGSTDPQAPIAVENAPAPKPVVSGTAQVRKRLKVAAANAKFQWLRNGVAISGAGEASYRLKSADVGKRISVRITPIGATPSASDPISDPSDPVVPGVFAPLNPVVSGDTKVEKTLTVGPLTPTVGTVTIEWLRNGRVILGATGTSYKLTIDDLGKKISARVTQTRKGFTDLVETTPETVAITSFKYLTAGKARVAGIVAEGGMLGAAHGTWTEGTTFKYQWYSGSTRILGATSKRLVITKDLRGKLIKVRITGSKPKYYSRSVVSAPAQIEGLRAPRNAKGWAWPTDTRRYTQGYHDGYSVDVASSAGGPIFAPYGGTVVMAGNDGGGVPWICRVYPSWWHGENQTVIIRHRYNDKIIYSSVNHVARGSSEALGITVGGRVLAGQQIATEGMSGCTSGPHTHFLLKNTPGDYWGDLKPVSYIGKSNPS